MDSDPSLKPETKEVWVGVRSPSTRRSSLQGFVNELRSSVSGINSYQDFLDQSSVDSFDSYETEMANRASDRLVTAENVGAARDIVEAAFASFSDFAGDSSNDTGVFAQADYDEYRTYLTNNGVGGVDADSHISVVRPLFAADDVLIEAVVNDLTSFSDLESWLDNTAGFDSADATKYRNDIESEFSDWSDFESTLNGATSLAVLLGEATHRETPVPFVEADVGAGDLYLRPPGDLVVERPNAATSDDVDQVADVTFKNVRVSDNNPASGDEITVSADAENTGSEVGRPMAAFRIDGDVEEVEDIRVPGNTTRTVQFTTTFFVFGEYEVTVGAATPVQVTVDANTSF